MKPTARKATGSVLAALALAGVVTGATVAWKRFGGINPYSAVDRQRATGGPAVVVTGAKVRRYENGRLVAEADAKRLTVGQDRANIMLQGIHNGVAHTTRGPMQFAAKTGTVYPNSRRIDLADGVRVKGTDFDIATDRANIDGIKGQIGVPGPVSGSLMGGRLTATSLTHRMNSSYTKILNPAWVGRIGSLPSAQGLPETAKNRVWDLRGDVAEQKGIVNYYTNAWANDGEVLVTAPNIAQDTKTNVITATKSDTERAVYRSAKADLVADKVVVYRSEHRAVCTGHVLMFVRAKKDWDKPLPKDEDATPLVPDVPAGLQAKMAAGSAMSQAEKDKVDEIRSGKNLRDFPMNLSADEVTYWYQEGERRAVAKGGNPTAFQKFEDGRWRQVWAPEAHYDGEKDLLDLMGDKSKRQVRMKNSVGDDTDAFAATVSTKEDETEETQYAKVKGPKGHLIDFTDDVPSDKKPGATKVPAKGSPPTGTPPPAGTPPPGKGAGGS